MPIRASAQRAATNPHFLRDCTFPGIANLLIGAWQTANQEIGGRGFAPTQFVRSIGMVEQNIGNNFELGVDSGLPGVSPRDVAMQL
jgi:hypothetical protein